MIYKAELEARAGLPLSLPKRLDSHERHCAVTFLQRFALIEQVPVISRQRTTTLS